MLDFFKTDERLAKAETRAKELDDKIFNLEEDLQCTREEVTEAKQELSTIKHEHKMADEDIKHMVKMQEEASRLEIKEAKIDAQAKTAEGIAAEAAKYQTKLTEALETQISDSKEVLKEILDRLPKVTAHVGGPQTMTTEK